MGDGHIFAQTTHFAHFVAVNGVDDATCTQEETSFEHGVGEEMEQTCHVSEGSMIINQNSFVTGKASTKCHHHKCDL